MCCLQQFPFLSQLLLYLLILLVFPPSRSLLVKFRSGKNWIGFVIAACISACYWFSCILVHHAYLRASCHMSVTHKRRITVLFSNLTKSDHYTICNTMFILDQFLFVFYLYFYPQQLTTRHFLCRNFAKILCANMKFLVLA